MQLRFRGVDLGKIRENAPSIAICRDPFLRARPMSRLSAKLPLLSHLLRQFIGQKIR